MADPGRPGVDDGVRRRRGVGIGRKVRLGLRSDPDPRAVMTLGDVDQDAVISAVGFVVTSQLRPKFRGLDPDRGVDARIERLGLVEDPHTDDVLFEVGSAACRRLLDDEAQEAGHPRRVGEPGARDDSFQRFLDRHGLQHVSAPRCRPVFSLRRPRSSHCRSRSRRVPEALCNRLFNSNPTAGQRVTGIRFVVSRRFSTRKEMP